MRSFVSGSVVYRSFTYPVNSESVELSSTSPVTPDSTTVAESVRVTVLVRVSAPVRWKECGPSRCQACSDRSTRADVIAACAETKCRASSSPKSSIWSTPYCRAKAYTVFFCESVGRT